MRLIGQSTHRANPMIDDSCPCCRGSLEGVKRAMSEVSRALEEPLPLTIQAQVAPAVDALRLSGREVMIGLRGAFGGLTPVPDLAAFRAAVVGLDGAIEARTAALPADECDALAGLRETLDRLDDALTALAREFDDASRLTTRRAESRLICEPVADRQKPMDRTIRAGSARRRAVAAAAFQAHRTAEGVGG